MTPSPFITGMCVFAVLAAARAARAARAAAAAGTFSSAAIGGDADSGISPARTYTHAVDFANVGAFPGLQVDTATTINGVPFHVGGANGPNYASTDLTLPFFADLPTNSAPSGPNTLYDLFEDFLHNSVVPPPPNQTLTLTGLTPGAQYLTSFYGVGFGVADANRVITITTSDGGQTVFDQNFTGEGNPNVLRYAFTADGPSITYTFDPVGTHTFHHYGFTNEIVPEPSAAAAVALLATLSALHRRRGRRVRAG